MAIIEAAIITAGLSNRGTLPFSRRNMVPFSLTSPDPEPIRYAGQHSKAIRLVLLLRLEPDPLQHAALFLPVGSQERGELLRRSKPRLGALAGFAYCFLN